MFGFAIADTANGTEDNAMGVAELVDVDVDADVADTAVDTEVATAAIASPGRVIAPNQMNTRKNMKPITLYLCNAFLFLCFMRIRETFLSRDNSR